MAIVPILAKFDLSGLPGVITKANKRFAENEARSFRRGTRNWSDENKPTFNVIGTNIGFGIMEYKVSTISKIYHWVNSGTDPHEISAVRASSLKFQEGYTPKTSPGKIGFTGSGDRSGEFRSPVSVTQSIEARDFTGQIKKKAPKRWSRSLETELKKYVQRNVK